MTVQGIAQEILSFTGTFNPPLLVSVFLLLFIGEFGFSIPYLLEGIWILTAYHTVKGTLAAQEMMIIWGMAVGGRAAGAAALYSLVRLGSPWLLRFYHRFFGHVLSGQNSPGNAFPARVFRRINLFSPVSVAFGRLIWLRIPLTITLALRRELKVLEIAVVLNSIAWDVVYIAVGLVGGNVQLTPIDLIIYAFFGLTILYGSALGVRRLARSWGHKK